MGKSQLIHDFIGYAFYGDVTCKSVELVNKLYKVYSALFGGEDVDRKELQTLICQEYNCMIGKGTYKLITY